MLHNIGDMTRKLNSCMFFSVGAAENAVTEDGDTTKVDDVTDQLANANINDAQES